MTIGIDFGTTNSSLCAIPDETWASRRDIGAGTDRPFPSVVAVDLATGAVLCGMEAWEKRRSLEANPRYEFVPSVKTLLGTGWKREIAGKIWNPKDIAAEVLRGLLRQARAGLDEKKMPSEAIVSIPVGLHADKRRDLRAAAAEAGLSISTFVGESTAAFAEHAETMKADTNVAVFDWGGGTLDVSILRNEKGTIRELSTSGLAFGGDAIDLKLARHVHSKVAARQNFSCAFEDIPFRDQDQLVVMCEQAKRDLGEKGTATVAMPAYGPFDPFHETFDRFWFAEFVKPEIDQAVDVLQKAVHEAHVGMAAIDRILVVGGTAKLVSLRERLVREFGEDRIVFADDAEWCVSRGAAKLGTSGVLCRSSQDVGIVLSTGERFPLLRENDTIDNWEGSWRFGITDTSEEAHLVFTGADDIDLSPDKHRCVPVPSYRFLQESIVLDAWIDENLVFWAEAHSNMRHTPTSERPVWKYERLKFHYDLKGAIP